jgi:hypothetical protein
MEGIWRNGKEMEVGFYNQIKADDRMFNPALSFD